MRSACSAYQWQLRNALAIFCAEWRHRPDAARCAFLRPPREAIFRTSPTEKERQALEPDVITQIGVAAA